MVPAVNSSRASVARSADEGDAGSKDDIEKPQ